MTLLNMASVAGRWATSSRPASWTAAPSTLFSMASGMSTSPSEHSCFAQSWIRSPCCTFRPAMSLRQGSPSIIAMLGRRGGEARTALSVHCQTWSQAPHVAPEVEISFGKGFPEGARSPTRAARRAQKLPVQSSKRASRSNAIRLLPKQASKQHPALLGGAVRACRLVTLTMIHWASSSYLRELSPGRGRGELPLSALPRPSLSIHLPTSCALPRAIVPAVMA